MAGGGQFGGRIAKEYASEDHGHSAAVNLVYTSLGIRKRRQEEHDERLFAGSVVALGPTGPTGHGHIST